MTYTILTTFFGGDPRFREMLRDWIDAVRKHAKTAEIVIATDDERVEDLPGWMLVDRKEPLRKSANAFDRKGQILVEALRRIDGPVLYLDCDAFMRRDPSRILFNSAFERQRFCMCHNAGDIKQGFGPYGTVTQRCAGVMYFGSDNHFAVCDWFEWAFREVARYLPDHPLLEQWAWCFLVRELGTPLMPWAMQWPVHRRGQSAEAYVYHLHGNEKWNRQKYLNPHKQIR